MITFVTAEFKAKVPGKAWEETPLYSELTFGLPSVDHGDNIRRQVITDTARSILKWTNSTEVRWNIKGSTQGHYVSETALRIGG